MQQRKTMNGKTLTQDEREAVVQTLRVLAQQYIQADFGSDIGGSRKMRLLEVEAIDLLEKRGFEPPPFLNSREMTEWADKIAAGENPQNTQK